ncbi:hypothetical protein D3C76_1653020 [compost metagenome]
MPVLGRVLGDRSAADNAGIVHQNVNVSESGNRLLNNTRKLFFLAQVSGDNVAAAADFVALVQYGIVVIGIGNQYQICACVGQGQGHAGSETYCTACNQCYFSCEIKRAH